MSKIQSPWTFFLLFFFFSEYALTPYEILMDDIRSRRYKLNKVMVDGELPPRVKKDAHDLILDFIRSRPPLKPVSIEILCLLQILIAYLKALFGLDYSPLGWGVRVRDHSRVVNPRILEEKGEEFLLFFKEVNVFCMSCFAFELWPEVDPFHLGNGFEDSYLMTCVILKKKTFWDLFCAYFCALSKVDKTSRLWSTLVVWHWWLKFHLFPCFQQLSLIFKSLSVFFWKCANEPSF